MPRSKSSGRPAAGAPGVKMLLTAASVAATIGGWAALSNTQNTASSATPIPAPGQSANLLTIKLAPLPTLVPPPDPKSIEISAPAVVAPSSNRPAVAAAPMPAPAAPQIAGLRVVNAPTGGGGVAGAPAPATTTRSSKP